MLDEDYRSKGEQANQGDNPHLPSFEEPRHTAGA
jgi:hypothetical protein